jgi:hypothetical protein
MTQARSSAGFNAGSTLADGYWTFWTMTGWDSEAAMKAYRGAGAHKAAMKKLPVWCDEACVMHFSADGLPSWAEAWELMSKQARFTPVQNPSPAHLDKRIDPLRPKLQQKIG